MGIFSGYYIASDLDGTFLDRNSSEVKRNIDKIKYFTANGGRFSFATGRIPAAVLSILPNCAEYVNFPVVTCTGMSFYDVSMKKAIYERCGDSDAITSLSKYLFDKYPHIAFRGIGDGEIISFQPDNRYIQYEIKSKELPVRFVPLDMWYGEKFLKLTLRDESDLLDKVKAEIEVEFEGVFALFKSGDDLLEVQTAGYSKAIMLAGIKKRLLEKGEDVTLICVGDHENDVEMLKAADPL